MKFKRLILVLMALVAVVTLAAFGFFALRSASAAYQSEQAWANARVQSLPDIGTTQRLSILPLIDKNAQPGLKGEWGVSYLIKTDKTTILFDVGQNADGSAPLIYNMEKLGITPDSFDTLVFSHNHPDHLGGLSQMSQGTFSFGKPTNLTGKRVFAPVAMSYPGTSPVVANNPTVIAQGVATTGTITFPEVIQLAMFTDLNVEQSLVINVEGKGLVVIAGCGHPTLQKMLPRATALVNAPVYGFVGGLHFMDADSKALQPSIDFLKTYQPKLLAPSAHDSGTAALNALKEAFPTAYRDVVVGQEIVIAE